MGVGGFGRSKMGFWRVKKWGFGRLKNGVLGGQKWGFGGSKNRVLEGQKMGCFLTKEGKIGAVAEVATDGCGSCN